MCGEVEADGLASQPGASLPPAEPITTDSDGAAALAVAAVPIVATAVATGDRGDGDSAVTFMGFLPIQAAGYGTITLFEHRSFPPETEPAPSQV
jgi:hypothetical protein